MDTGPKQRRIQNPRYNASWLSILTFGWTIETFKLGYSRDLQETDLYGPLPEHRSDVLGGALQRAWEKEVYESHRRNPSLMLVLFKTFGCQLFLYGLALASMEFLIRLQQPLFLGLLLRHYNTNHDYGNSSVEHASTHGAAATAAAGHGSWGTLVACACGVSLCSVLNVLVQHPCMMATMHLGMKMRVAVCSLIYRKALKLSMQARLESNAGQVVNLLANDVNRFDVGPIFAHYLWIGPLETVFMTMYLYREVGVAAVYGALLIAAVVPFQTMLGCMTAFYRRETAKRTDERVRLMNEIVAGVEVIKMYTWEMPFRKIIEIARRHEIRYIKRTSYVRGVILSFMMFTSRVGIFITLLGFVSRSGSGGAVSAEKVFVLTCYYNIIKQTMTLYFPQAVGQIAEMGVAVQRIREYLLSEESVRERRELVRRVSFRERHFDKLAKRVTIQPMPSEFETTRMAWIEEPATSQSGSKPILKTVEEHPGLRAPSTHKKIETTTIIMENASCKWLRSSRVDDLININLKIRSGTLTTLIGTVGSGKSSILYLILEELACTTGRVSVLGSVSYASQEPWLFAASVRQNILFGEQFVRSRYTEVCRVCALERDLSLFPHGDKTVVGERGVALSGGQRARINLARAIYKQAEIYLLDDPLSAVDTHVAKHLFETCIKNFLAEKTVVLVTHQLQFLKSADHIVIMDKGEILAQGSFAELQKSGLDIVKMMEEQSLEAEVVTQGAHVQPEVKLREVMRSISRISFASLSLQRRTSLPWETSFTEVAVEAEQQAMGSVSSAIYYEYFLAGASRPFAALVVLMFLLAQGCASAGDYWLSRWSKAEDKLTGNATVDEAIWSAQGLQRKHYVIVFAVITLGTIFVALTRAVTFFTLCMRSSIRLHDHMFSSISRSPMKFFHKNPSGRILNRFSKDMGAVDELLPQAMIDCIQIMLNLVGVVAVVLLVDITLLVPVTAAIIIFYILRVIYIRTSGAVKRLEGITRSPVFGHLNATITGLATIRSFNAEEVLVMEFDRHQDLHSAAWYLFITSSRAFGFFLDVVCVLFILCVTFGCLLRTDAEGSNVGLAITQSISLTGVFQWGMRQSAEMENQMTSVERVLEYTQLPAEPPLASAPGTKPPKEWPQEGGITFHQLSLKYTEEDPYVLFNVNCVVKPKNKIGIVGRTGAGKSSVIQALFRLAHTEGSIIIDGVNIMEVGLHDLRAKVSIIPQEPVLFSGTIRKNLDPFDEYTDDLLKSALDNVELKTVHEGLEGLERLVSEGGTNFSVGQRQLVCLARAIVRDNRVLVLDEATANVDAQTDHLIQTAIRTHFQHCTVLTIAHRLHTVMDSDKIMVLDAGRLVEYDHPHVLLKSNNGFFTKMVEQTGAAMSRALHQMAKESYEREI